MRFTPFLFFFVIILVGSVNADTVVIIEGVETPSFLQRLFTLQSTVPLHGIVTGESNQYFIEFFGKAISSEQAQPAKVSVEVFPDIACTGRGTLRLGSCTLAPPISRATVSLTLAQIGLLKKDDGYVAVRFTLVAPNNPGTYQVCGTVLTSTGGRTSLAEDCARFNVKSSSGVAPFCPDSGSASVPCACKFFDCEQEVTQIDGGFVTRSTCFEFRRVSANSCPRHQVLKGGLPDCNSGYVRSGNECVRSTPPPPPGGSGGSCAVGQASAGNGICIQCEPDLKVSDDGKACVAKTVIEHCLKTTGGVQLFRNCEICEDGFKPVAGGALSNGKCEAILAGEQFGFESAAKQPSLNVNQISRLSGSALLSSVCKESSTCQAGGLCASVDFLEVQIEAGSRSISDRIAEAELSEKAYIDRASEAFASSVAGKLVKFATGFFINLDAISVEPKDRGLCFIDEEGGVSKLLNDLSRQTGLSVTILLIIGGVVLLFLLLPRGGGR